jgi:hypothetical protein
MLSYKPNHRRFFHPNWSAHVFELLEIQTLVNFFVLCVDLLYCLHIRVLFILKELPLEADLYNSVEAFHQIRYRTSSYFNSVLSTETREGWPLLTVETEMNGDSKKTNDRGPHRMVCWTCHAGTIDFSLALAALVSPPATWAGRRAGPPISVFLVLPSLQNLGTFKMLSFSFEPLGYERSSIYKKTA